MKKAIVLGLVLTCFLSPLAYAMPVTDAGNVTCPVSGDKVSGKDFVEVNGKSYGLCCPMCAAKLKANPGKYLGDASKGVTGQPDGSM